MLDLGPEMFINVAPFVLLVLLTALFSDLTSLWHQLQTTL